MNEVRSTAERPWVPSPREIADGAVPSPQPVTAASATQPPGRRRSSPNLREFLHSLNPRVVAGGAPVLPLLVFATLGVFARWEQDALGILVPQIRSDFGLSTGLFVFAIGAGPVVGLIVAPFMGWVADRVSRLRLIQIGAPVHHLATALLSLAHSVPLLVLFPMISAAGAAAEAPASLPLLTDYYPLRSRARIFYFFGMGSALALGAPLAAALIDERIGWRATLASIGLGVTGISFLLFRLREPIRGRVERLEQGVPEADAERPPPPPGWTESMRAAWSVGTVRRICYAIPFLVAAGIPLHVYLLLYFADVWHLAPTQRGLLATGAGIAGIVGLSLSGPVSERLLAERPGRIFPLLGGILVLSGISTLLLALSGSLVLAILFYVPIGAFGALLAPSYQTLISRLIPVRIRAFGLSLAAFWGLGGLLLLPIVFSLTGFNLGEQDAILIFSSFHFVGAVLIASAGGQVARDIRAAAAANEAEADARRAREAGLQKLLVVRDLEVAYGGSLVLSSIDLDIERGELLALTGTNGAGKSTLLRAIAGVQQPTNGAVFLDGLDVTHRPPDANARDGVVFMPGGRAVFPGLTVAENLRLAAAFGRHDRGRSGAPTAAALERFPVLGERLDQRAGSLSGGEQQMLALSQALLMQPRLLMIDELSLGLAPAVVEQLLDVIREINTGGTTVILVEQSINVALSIARRAIFLERGRILFDGAVADLLARGDLVRSVFLAGAGVTVTSVARRSPQFEAAQTGLEAMDLDLAFGGVTALRGARLTVRPGEVVGIIGPNGAGKTTLFDVLSGYAPPQAGSVRLAGRDLAGMGPDARSRLGLGRSFQNARLFGSLSVRECIAVALEKHLTSRSAIMAAAWLPPLRASERRAAARVDDLIEILNLQPYAGKFVQELSTGTRRMVDVACVMAADPNVLLLDEPSSGLAQAEVEVLGPLIRRLTQDTGCGVALIEHDIPLVAGVSDRLVAMELGAPICEGEPSEVINDSQVVRAYLGASQAAIQRSGVLAEALAVAGIPPEHL